LPKTSPDFWAAKVILESKSVFEHLDRGIFSIYFFNILHLHQGEAIYQGSGVPHAYLEGQNIELMSNSDNVLRAGLTPKHIDVQELMKHTQFDYIQPEIMPGDIFGKLIRYNCPIPDFQLQALTLSAGESFSDHSKGPEIWIMMKGRADWTGFRSVHTQQGQAVFMLPDEYFTLHAIEDSQLFRAIVP
jgi:mannose-6-phosphate isomerase